MGNIARKAARGELRVLCFAFRRIRWAISFGAAEVGAREGYGRARQGRGRIDACHNGARLSMPSNVDERRGFLLAPLWISHSTFAGWAVKVNAVSWVFVPTGPMTLSSNSDVPLPETTTMHNDLFFADGLSV